MGKLTKSKFLSYFEGMLVPPRELERIWKQVEEDLHGDDKTNVFLATYTRAYQARYGTAPIIKGKPSAIGKRIVRDHGTEQASLWVTAYLQMSEYDYVRNRHDLVTFERCLQAVANFVETGKTVTRVEASKADRRQSNANAFKAVMEKRRG